MTQTREGPGPQTWAQRDPLDEEQGVRKRKEKEAEVEQKNRLWDQTVESG